MADIREEARAEPERRWPMDAIYTLEPTFTARELHTYEASAFQAGAVWADARKVEGDPREFAHIACDCVPDLGPEHCHLCSERGGKGPVPWSECESRKVEVTDEMIERAQDAFHEFFFGLEEPLTLREKEITRQVWRVALRAALGGEQE